MYLGLDLGTSGLKGVVIDDAQTVVAEAVAPLSVSRPHPGWSEQDPAHWIAAAEEVLTRLGAATSLSAVRGIGLSGQMHGATLLAADHEPLRPAILWNDTRSSAEASALDTIPMFRSISGNIVFPGFTAPKLVWVKANEPDVFGKTALVLLPKDMLRLWLTGEAVSEPSDAAGTSWLDTGERTWSPELLGACDMTVAQMPRLVEGSEVSGTLRDRIATRFGFSSGVVVAGGAGDNAGAAVGMGVVEEGQAFLSLGTSGVLFAPSPGYNPAPETSVHTFCHALPGLWHQMGVILAASDALSWHGQLLGADPVALAADIGPLKAPSQTIFLPYLGGERTPHNDARIRGAFVGLGHETDRVAATRAVMEGVAFAVADCRDALEAAGTRVERAIAVGGGSRSRAWLEIMATALGIPIDVPGAGDYGAAFGAARLGQMAATGGGAELATPPAIADTIEPDRELERAFSDAHDRFSALYLALRGVR
ncbi:xylulokinase [Acuticoccus sediminis]|uniref:xylulokinase n=1 Tax=Acuticoccus sediminis TaxID=2184697 RepID=UPI001CFD7853|nr:xylulokinase [Acuticoccus sediminis]